MADDTHPARWTGLLAVVTLPGHVDRSNADQVREQLLVAMNRGAAAVIADLTGTISCDYSGTDALARAYRRAVGSGVQLRLAAASDSVRRTLRLSGLDQVVSVYPTLEDAIAAGAGHRSRASGLAPVAVLPASREPVPPAGAVSADSLSPAEELADVVINNIFDVGMILRTVAERPREEALPGIAEALARLDDIVREVRDRRFAEHREDQPGHSEDYPRQLRETMTQNTDHAALLRQRIAHTAYTLHRAAAETAALLQQRADLVVQPGRLDYPTEIKRWQALADQAGQIAKGWEQS